MQTPPSSFPSRYFFFRNGLSLRLLPLLILMGGGGPRRAKLVLRAPPIRSPGRSVGRLENRALACWVSFSRFEGLLAAPVSSWSSAAASMMLALVFAFPSMLFMRSKLVKYSENAIDALSLSLSQDACNVLRSLGEAGSLFD